MRPLRIAMIGQQGIPACHGGVEKAVEEVSARLVEAGHQVTVFNTIRDADRRLTEHRGMRIRYLPSTAGKHTGNLTLSFLSALRVVLGRYDVAHFHAIGPSMFTPICRLRPGLAVVTTIHGRDDLRAKWGPAAKVVLGVSAQIAARVPERVIVVSRALQDDMKASFGCDTVYITNGVDEPPATPPASDILYDLDLWSGRYFLSVGRLVPEKAVVDAAQAFSRVDTAFRYVIVGGSSNTDAYAEELERIASADDRIRVVGPVYGDDLDALYRGAGALLMPSRLEGLPLVFLEGASYGLPVIASDIAPHVEIVGHLGSGPGHRLFEVGNIDAMVEEMLDFLSDPGREQAVREQLAERVLRDYSWSSSVEALERLYADLVD